MSIETRFWSKVDRSGGPDACWPWMAALTKKGYGRFVVRHGETVRAHRFAFQISGGEVGDDEMVCHRCDEPACCNPKHLWRGNAYCNNVDARVKGRRPPQDQSGEKNNGARLTAADVAEIKTRLATATNVDLGEEFGVHHATISAIRCGKTWRKSRHPEQPRTSLRAR